MQHRELFIVGLLPHLRIPLTQKKVTSQSKGLEIKMQLKSTLAGEKNLVGMEQV
jgi:hypothetical protein